MVYATIGIPLFFVVMANLGRVLTRALKFLWSYVRRLYYTQTFRRVRKGISHCVRSKCLRRRDNTTLTSTDTAPAAAAVAAQSDDTSSYVEFEVDDHFNLHPLVAITVTVVYIFFGALVYTQWEAWTYLEAFYFIFVSVSTIGFGDLVPAHPKYFLASSIYILLGLSLVAMVINVIMEFFNSTMNKAKEKVENISKSIGLDLDKLGQAVSPKPATRSLPPSASGATPSGHAGSASPEPPPRREPGEINRAFSVSSSDDDVTQQQPHGDIKRVFSVSSHGDVTHQQRGKIKRGVSDHINHMDVCKDSGYAENIGSSSDDDDDSDDAGVHRRSQHDAQQHGPSAKTFEIKIDLGRHRSGRSDHQSRGGKE